MYHYVEMGDIESDVQLIPEVKIPTLSPMQMERYWKNWELIQSTWVSSGNAYSTMKPTYYKEGEYAFSGPNGELLLTIPEGHRRETSFPPALSPLVKQANTALTLTCEGSNYDPSLPPLSGRIVGHFQDGMTFGDAINQSIIDAILEIGFQIPELIPALELVLVKSNAGIDGIAFAFGLALKGANLIFSGVPLDEMLLEFIQINLPKANFIGLDKVDPYQHNQYSLDETRRNMYDDLENRYKNNGSRRITGEMAEIAEQFADITAANPGEVHCTGMRMAKAIVEQAIIAAATLYALHNEYIEGTKMAISRVGVLAYFNTVMSNIALQYHNS